MTEQSHAPPTQAAQPRLIQQQDVETAKHAPDCIAELMLKLD